MASKKSLFDRSNEFKMQADLILAESGVKDLFKLYGEVKLAGSYPLNVMLRPDLDIYVLSKNHDFKKLLLVINKLLSKNYFQQICLANWKDFEKKRGIKGYYLEPKVNVGENRWKLDVWFITEDQYEPYTERFLDLLKNNPNQEEKRQLILEIKDHYREGERYKANINGRMIYKAVLEEGIKTLEDFKYRHRL